MIASVFLGAGACGSSTAPSIVAGTSVLTSVNGNSLPATTFSSLYETDLAISDVLVLPVDGSWSSTGADRIKIPATGLDTILEQHTGGTFEVRHGNVYFTTQGRGFGAASVGRTMNPYATPFGVPVASGLEFQGATRQLYVRLKTG